MEKATSKTWTRTLDLDPEKFGPWKTINDPSITGKHLCWSLFLIKLNRYCNSLVCLVFILEIIPKTIKHVTYLVNEHLNVRSIYYIVSCLIEKSFWNLPSLLHNLTYLSLLNSFLLLVLSTFPLFLKGLNNYIFRWLAYKSVLAEF